MARCPVCGSRQVVTVVRPRRYVCGDCAATWVLDRGVQRTLWHPSMAGFVPHDDPTPPRLHRAS